MDNSQPRFEFRIWGNHLSPVRDLIAATAASSAPRESAETYILSAATDTANVKIRAGLLDIKLMLEQQGRLERWRPALKAPFPIDARWRNPSVVCGVGGRRPLLRENRQFVAAMRPRTVRGSSMLVRLQRRNQEPVFVRVRVRRAHNRAGIVALEA